MSRRSLFINMLIAFLLLLGGKQALSQDILGGEIRLRTLGGNHYEGRVILHYDKANYVYRTHIIVDWGLSIDTLHLISNVEILPGILECEYQGTEHYPGPGHWVFRVAENQWSPLIEGVPSTGATTFQINYEFNISPFTSLNNSAIVLNRIYSTTSSNGIITYDPNFYDLDGDSLTYRLLPCNFPGYVQPDGLLIDSITGVISFSPDTLGYFAICVEVEEWKITGQNRVLVGTSIKSLYLKASVIAGISEKDQESLVKLYPNPGQGDFTIQSTTDLTRITVYAVDGKKMMDSGEILNREHHLSLNQLQSGVYLVHVYTSSGVEILKYIMQP